MQTIVLEMNTTMLEGANKSSDAFMPLKEGASISEVADSLPNWLWSWVGLVVGTSVGTAQAAWADLGDHFVENPGMGIASLGALGAVVGALLDAYLLFIHKQSPRDLHAVSGAESARSEKRE